MTTSAGSVVATPSIVVSSMARSIRRRARSRSGAQTISLRDQVVVVLRDRVAGAVAGVEAHAGSGRLIEPGDRARRGDELAARRVLGVDAHFDGVALASDLVLREVERLAGRDAQLPLDEVESGHQFGDGCSTWRRVFISKKKNAPSW